MLTVNSVRSSDALPTSSSAFNFAQSETFEHNISLCTVKHDSDKLKLMETLSSAFKPPTGSRITASRMKDIKDLMQKDMSNSTRNVEFAPSNDGFLQPPTSIEAPKADPTFTANFEPSTSTPQVSPVKQVSQPAPTFEANFDSFEPSTPEVKVTSTPPQIPDDGKVRFDLQCSIVENLLITEKSSQIDKIELHGTASGTISNHSGKSLLQEPDLHGHLGVKYSINDSRSVIKSLVSGSKAVTTNTKDDSDVQKTVTATIDCKDINSFITKAKSAGSSASSSSFVIPAIPIFKYLLVDTVRPTVMKTKQLLNIAATGDTKIHVIVHVLFNVKVLTGSMMKDVSVQISCSPLGLIANVDCSTATIASTTKSGGVGKFQASNKIVTWSFGDLKLKEQPSISMEATIELVSAADANSSVNATTLPSIYLPMIVKGNCDCLISQVEIEAALPSESETASAVITWPSGDNTTVDNNVLIHEIVEVKKQTKLECRFL